MAISLREFSFMVFRCVPGNNAAEFSLDGMMLNVLMEADGKKNIAEVAKNTGLNMAHMKKTIQRLLKLRFIEPVKNAISRLDKDFFHHLQAQLSLAIGPIAPIIIEDTVQDLGHSLSGFPSHRAAELIDLIAREIRKEDKRDLFKKSMVKKIREKGY